MYHVYGYFEVERHDCPFMEYYISTKEESLHYLMGTYATEAEAEKRVIELYKEDEARLEESR